MDPRGGPMVLNSGWGPMDLRVGFRWTSGWGPMDLRVGSDGPQGGVRWTSSGTDGRRHE